MAVQNENGTKTFIATEALERYRRVKLTTGSGTAVEYADAGEDAIGVTQDAVAAGARVAVKLITAPGTFKVTASAAITAGAVLYGANDGKVSSSSSGSAIGRAGAAASGDGSVIELISNNSKSTTAGTVSIADAGGFTSQVTVEAALQEIYQHIKSIQAFIAIPLMWLRELASGAIGNIAANGGLLASDTTPILNTVNGDTDGALRVSWAASNSDPIGFQVPLPPDLDTDADLLIKMRAASAGATDTPVFSADSYFNEGDTKVEDDSDAVSDAYAEKTITIAAADVPAGAQTLSVELTPGAHTTDALYLTALWIEYKRKILTS